MKPLRFIFLIFLPFFIKSQNTCSTSLNISNGSCININFPGSANMAGLCVGGSNPAIYLRFTAGSCSSFNIVPSSNSSVVGTAIYTFPGCSYVAGSAECHENVVAGKQFNADAYNTSGTYLLTSGTQYVMLLWGPVGASTFNICYNANNIEAASNECSGALGLGISPTNFYNGNDCSFTGSSIDATTTDPAASGLCAGSLENTQWVKFTPQSGVSSFQIIGSNISCTGGGCGFQFGIFSGSCGSLLSEGCYGNKVCSGGQATQGPTNTSSTDGFIITWSGTSSTGFTATITKTGGGLFNGTENFFLVMDGNADADCSYTLVGTNIIPLPIELLYFKGQNMGSYNLIEWSTATEIENQYFTLERSTDAINWNEINEQAGAGNSSSQIFYQFLDFNYSIGNYNYYRLSQKDFNGYKKYFQIISIQSSDVKSENCVVEYFDLFGNRINNFNETPSGIYLKKCNNKIQKIVKLD